MSTEKENNPSSHIIYKSGLLDGTMRVKDIPINLFMNNINLIEAALYSDPDAIKLIPDEYIERETKLTYLGQMQHYPHLVPAPEHWKEDAMELLDEVPRSLLHFGRRDPDLVALVMRKHNEVKKIPDEYPAKILPPSHTIPSIRQKESEIEIDKDLVAGSKDLYEYLRSQGAPEKTYSREEEVNLILPSEELLSTDHFIETKFLDGNNIVTGKRELLKPHLIVVQSRSPIGLDADEPVYQSWVMPSEDVRNEFGEDVLRELVSNNSKTVIRNVPLKAIQVTQEAIEEHFGHDIYKGRNIENIFVNVPWLSDMALIKPGDYITEHGYPIKAEDMVNYNLVMESDLKKSSSNPSRDFDSPSPS